MKEQENSIKHSVYQVLYIEDDPGYAQKVKKSIESHKIDGLPILCRTVPDGQKGLQLLKQDNCNFIKVVICDWRLFKDVHLDPKDRSLQPFQGPTIASFIAQMRNRVAIYFLTDKREATSRALRRKNLPSTKLFDKSNVDFEDASCLGVKHLVNTLKEDLKAIEKEICFIPQTKPWKAAKGLGSIHLEYRKHADYPSIEARIGNYATTIKKRPSELKKLIASKSLGLYGGWEPPITWKGGVKGKTALASYMIARAFREALLYYRLTKKDELTFIGECFGFAGNGMRYLQEIGITKYYTNVGLDQKNGGQIYFQMLPEEHARLESYFKFAPSESSVKRATYQVAVWNAPDSPIDGLESVKGYLSKDYPNIQFAEIEDSTDLESGEEVLLEQIDSLFIIGPKNGVRWRFILSQLDYVRTLRFKHGFKGPIFFLSEFSAIELQSLIEKYSYFDFLKHGIGYHSIDSKGGGFDIKKRLKAVEKHIEELSAYWPDGDARHEQPWFAYQLPDSTLWDTEVFFNPTDPNGFLRELVHSAKRLEGETDKGYMDRFDKEHQRIAAFAEFHKHRFTDSVLAAFKEKANEEKQISPSTRDWLYQNLIQLKGYDIVPAPIEVVLIQLDDMPDYLKQELGKSAISCYFFNEIDMAKEWLGQSANSHAIILVWGGAIDVFNAFEWPSKIISLFWVSQKLIASKALDKESLLIHTYTAEYVKTDRGMQNLIEDLQDEYAANKEACENLLALNKERKQVSNTKEHKDGLSTYRAYLQARIRKDYWMLEKDVDRISKLLFTQYKKIKGGLHDGTLFAYYANKPGGISPYNNEEWHLQYKLWRVFRLLMIRVIQHESDIDSFNQRDFLKKAKEFPKYLFKELPSIKKDPASKTFGDVINTKYGAYYHFLGVSQKDSPLLLYEELSMLN